MKPFQNNRMGRFKLWTSPPKRYSDPPQNQNPSGPHPPGQHRTGQHTSVDDGMDRWQGEMEEPKANHERTLPIEELIEAYERFKLNDTLATKHSDVVRYVE